MLGIELKTFGKAGSALSGSVISLPSLTLPEMQAVTAWGQEQEGLEGERGAQHWKVYRRRFEVGPMTVLRRKPPLLLKGVAGKRIDQLTYFKNDC